MNETQMSGLFSKRSKIIILVIIGLLIATFIGALFWLYTGTQTKTKENIFAKVPLPVALVQTRHITSKDLYKRIEVAQKVLEATGQKNVAGLREDILSSLIENQKIDILSSQRQLSVNNEEIDQAYTSLYTGVTGATEEQFRQELESVYGLTLNTLKSDILKPSLQKEQLSKWFNSQESLNQEPYKKGRELLNQLEQGSDFDEVATKYNEDVGSKQFAGDQGFIAEKELLPEFRDKIVGMAINDKQLVASRYGLHIIKLNGIEDSEEGKRYNIQQIFIIPGDFQKWLDGEFGNIKSVKLL